MWFNVAGADAQLLGVHLPLYSVHSLHSEKVKPKGVIGTLWVCRLLVIDSLPGQRVVVALLQSVAAMGQTSNVLSSFSLLSLSKTKREYRGEMSINSKANTASNSSSKAVLTMGIWQ